MSKPTVYIESTIPSYLTARVSNNATVVGHQVTTWLWWEIHKNNGERFISSVVEDEIRAGDPEFARRRMDIVEGLPMLDITDEVIELAVTYMRRLPIPDRAEADAYHLALATVHNIDYLVTWNLKHMASSTVKRLLPTINANYRLGTPVICTPEDLLYA